MQAFLTGVILTVLAAVPVLVWLLRRKDRLAETARDQNRDIDREITKLTGELAHEIKNPLSTIKVNLKLASEFLEDIDLSDTAKSGLDRSTQGLAGAMRKITVIGKETDRLDQIVDGFLQYVRQPELQLVTLDLNELVGDMIDFYSPQAYSYGLTLRHSLATEPLIARVDAGALKQVLLNLFINAQQAMDETGDLMVRTARQDDKALLRISDTGEGIAPDRLEAVFRPHYSSRPDGTGLGLATAKKIVEAHRGVISVHSEVGKGTSFTIELPRVDRPGAGNEADQ